MSGTRRPDHGNTKGGGPAATASDTTRVSVVVPTYNGAAHILETLHSAQRQTLPPAEIVVVDDASTDDTASLVAAAAARSDVPLRLIRLQKNSGGPARPLNLGIRYAEGPVIALLEQDDRMRERRLELSVAAALSQPDCSLIIGQVSLIGNRPGDFFPFWSDGGQFSYLIEVEHGFGLSVVSGETAMRSLLKRNFIMTNSNVCFLKSLWERVGGFSTRYRVCADFDFSLRACECGPVAVIDEVLCEYRLHGDSLYRTSGGIAAREAGELRLRTARQHYTEWADEFWIQYWSLRSTLRNHLRSGECQAAWHAFRSLLRTGALRLHLETYLSRRNHGPVARDTACK